MSGHSKWSTIKRQKGAKDEKRGQLFTKLAREITVAARSGVPDPESNFRLRIAVQKARAENMPRDNIERAIERAAGGAGSDNYDEVSYEGFGPGGVAVVIQALTDNRNRTVGEVRSVLTRAGGTLGESGSVGWMFDYVGSLLVGSEDVDAEELALVAIDAGAQDVQIEDDVVEVFTEVTDLHVVQEALVAAGYDVRSAEPTMRPKTLMEAEEQTAIKNIRMLEKLEDLDDVQQVYSNLDISEEVLAAVG
ncbi:MAG: YebC/PmpR family DNA-binding transcriptional regulator [Thermomicrobiales bacterium]|nr:YebC/PmpR family DNA-binding transcriptional regulator [Thermomicrobiales bacterium]